MPSIELRSTKNLVPDARAGSKPQLEEFADYRDYLRERLAFEKERNSNLSLHFFARKMKVSTSFLSVLLAKKKHLSLDTLYAVADYLQLEGTERIHLILMVLEITAKSEAQTKYFAALRLQSSGFLRLELGMPKYDLSALKSMFGSELRLILDALVRDPSFREDPEWIMPRLLGKRSETVHEVMTTVREVLQGREAIGLQKGESTLTAVPQHHASNAEVFKSGFASFTRAMQDPEAMMPYIFASQSFLYTREAYLEAFEAFSDLSKKLKEIESRHPGGDRAMVFSAAIVTGAKPPKPQT